MQSLPLFVRLTGRPVILVGTGEAADAKRRLLDRAGAVIVDEAAQASLAIVAIEDADEAEATVARLRARTILVNAVDRPHLCDFTLPAIVDREPVLIAIGTGGVSAGLAAALRQQIEALLPANLGALARALHEARDALAARFPTGPERRRAIGALLAPGGPLDPFVGHDAPDALTAATTPPEARLEHVALTSSDPDELTLRAARLLALADRLYHPPYCPPAILDRARADAERIAGPPPASPLPGLSVELVDRS